MNGCERQNWSLTYIWNSTSSPAETAWNTENQVLNMVTTFWCIDEIEGTISTWQPDNKDIKNKIKNKRKWKKFRLSKPDYGGKRGLFNTWIQIRGHNCFSLFLELNNIPFL